MKKNVRLLLFAIFMALSSTTTYAQVDSTNLLLDLSFEELLQLEVSTITKTSSNIMDIPGVVTIITKKDSKPYR